jgi:hypothetical protein
VVSAKEARRPEERCHSLKPAAAKLSLTKTEKRILIPFLWLSYNYWVAPIGGQRSLFLINPEEMKLS